MYLCYVVKTSEKWIGIEFFFFNPPLFALVFCNLDSACDFTRGTAAPVTPSAAYFIA